MTIIVRLEELWLSLFGTQGQGVNSVFENVKLLGLSLLSSRSYDCLKGNIYIL